MPPTDFRIVHLVDEPQAKPTVVQWFIEEWMPWYGPNGPGDAEADLAACGSREHLPICLVALKPDGTLLGTVALKDESVGSELGVGPWLAALLVGRDQRGKGVGTALIEAIEKQAKSMGFEALYCSTDTARTILACRGWDLFGSSESLRGAVAIFRLDLRREPTFDRA